MKVDWRTGMNKVCHLGPKWLAVTVMWMTPFVGKATETPGIVHGWQDSSWIDSARTLSAGQALRLENVEVENLGRLSMDLEAFRVFATNARIVVNGEQGERELAVPDNVYLRGRLDGHSGSRVVLTVRASGEVRGLMAKRGELWIVDSMPKRADGTREMANRAVNRAAIEDGHAAFRCEVGAAPAMNFEELVPKLAGTVQDSGPETRFARAATVARIAIESDYEYFQKFGNTTDAVDYAADLIAYTSSIYEAEIGTGMMISHTSIWEVDKDPWTQTDTTCGLFEFGRYWNDNNSGVARTTAYFLSGKSNNGGIAWVGVLCQSAFNTSHGGGCPDLGPDIDNYGGAYAFTSGIDGNFDPASPNVLWDIVATAHELGHNFNSPHTHCYGNLGGAADPIDECNSGQCGNAGCHCGATSLPCETSGAGCGTIMSYCHLLSGGLSNLSLTLGLDHPHGVMPERVPQRMADHVASRAASFPACFAAGLPSDIFADGFESGDTLAWSASVP